MPDSIIADKEATEAVAQHTRQLELLQIQHDLKMEEYRITQGD
jgi:hypothetical protein